MRVFERAPTSALHPFVDRFWGLSAERDEVVTLAEVLPGVGAELMVHLGAPLLRDDGGRLPSSHLLCLRESTLRTRAAAGVDVFCVRFRAGAVRHFIDAKMHEVADVHAAFDDVAGPVARVLREGLGARRDFADRATFVEGLLLHLRARHLRPDALVDRAIRRIYTAGGQLRIAEVARELGVVPRHLARSFYETAGLSPKRFARLTRFYKTVRSLALDPRQEIGRAASNHGYFDQAHFAHEFGELARQPAAAFLRATATTSHFYKPSLGA